MSAPHPPATAAGPHVLRLCSVFEPRADDLGPQTARFDPIGGMQNHTAVLTRYLDAQGLRQTVVTARLSAPVGREPLGRSGVVVRVGTSTPRFRQSWALAAVPTVARPGSRIHLVHVHQGEDLVALPLGWLAARWHRCPLVATVHCSVRHTLHGSTLRSRLLRGLGGLVERAVLRRADAVIVLAARTAALLEGDGVAPQRIAAIPSGFDPALFASLGPDRFPQVTAPRVAYVGRLAAQKRVDLLVEAFGLLRQPAHLLVLGDGPERARVQRAVAASPARDRITLAGFVPHHSIPSVLGSVDILVLPSAYEELGSVLVEAMAAGLPVVATAVGGIPEVVADGRTGLLVAPEDAGALAAAVDSLLADPARAKEMGEQARLRSQDWSWPALALRVAAVYESVWTQPQPS